MTRTPAGGETIRARWLARFGDESALAKRLAWDGRDAAWLEDAPGLMLARMQRRAARSTAFLQGLDAATGHAALGVREHGPDHEAVTALLCRATGWRPETLARLVEQVVREADATGGGPVQAALARTTLGAAVAAAREASTRLARDSAHLGAVLGFDAASLRRVEATGDPHAGGRRVLRLEDGAGVAVYLKPRPPDGERLLARLASSLPGGGGLARVKLLVRRSWFWMAEAQHAVRDGGAEQAGALLAIADVVGAVDLHTENVMPTATGPAVLDAEMALHPDLPLDLVSPPRRSAARSLRCSPLRTGLLPEPDYDAHLCGLSGWLPAAGPDAAAFTNRLLRGYRQAFRQLVSNSSHDALGTVRGAVRLLVRPTHAYARVLAALRDTGRAKDPAAAFLLLETLRVGMARNAKRRPVLWPLPAAEEAALFGGDVPRLWMAWDGLDIHEGRTGPTGAALRISPRDYALARAARLGAMQLATRCVHIRRALL